MSGRKVKFRYIGKGEFYQGIPARDLTEEDVARLDKEQQAVLAASPLYQKIETAQKTEAT